MFHTRTALALALVVLAGTARATDRKSERREEVHYNTTEQGLSTSGVAFFFLPLCASGNFSGGLRRFLRVLYLAPAHPPRQPARPSLLRLARVAWRRKRAERRSDGSVRFSPLSPLHLILPLFSLPSRLVPSSHCVAPPPSARIFSAGSDIVVNSAENVKLNGQEVQVNGKVSRRDIANQSRTKCAKTNKQASGQARPIAPSCPLTPLHSSTLPALLPTL